MTFRRRIADFLERTLEVRIVGKGQLPVLFEQEHLSRFFSTFEIDCVFDVGANAGQYASMIRHKCGFSGPIISFEPIPALASALKVQAASDRNWFIEQTALGKEAGMVDFHVASEDQFSSMNRFRIDGPLGGTPSDLLRIDASTLDLQFDKYQSMLGFRRPFLKMDTQGSDLDVASGAGERLRKFVGLQSELSIDPVYENVPSAFEAINFYRSKGFNPSAFVPNNAGQFPRLYEIDCILYRSDA
jgi:FkbM family methyltransferase